MTKALQDKDYEELERVKAEYEELAERDLQQRQELEERGVIGHVDSGNASATTRQAMSVTEDTAQDIIGRMTAMQLGQQKMISLVTATTETLKSMMSGLGMTLSSVTEQLASSYLELREINENTALSAKSLVAIRSDINDIKSKIATL